MNMTEKLAVGDSAPDFTLPTDDGTFTLSEHRGRPVILYFYPAAMTPGCTTEACDFRDNLNSLRRAGFLVVGISPDGPETLARFREKEHLTFVLASDPDRVVLTAYGAFGDKTLYGRLTRGVIRSTVVVGADGRVELAQYGVRAKGHVAKLRKDLGLD